jgi:Tol biopolymer transport system component
MELAFVADWDGDWEIYLIRADGTGLSQLTNNETQETNPKWSPTGKKIAFVMNLARNPKLYVAVADGSEGGFVAEDLEATYDLAWSPTGDTIAFQSLDDVYVVTLETDEAVNVTLGAAFTTGEPSFSPDGSTLALLGNAPDESIGLGLFLVEVDGTGLREVSFPQGGVFTPSWHPFEDKILFEGYSLSEGAGLYLASADGAVTQLPMLPLYRAPKPAWSPDGAMLGYLVGLSGFDSSGERLPLHSLHVATAAGDLDLVLLQPPDEPDKGLSIFEFAWGPDSRHVAYTIPAEEGVDLFVLDICDGSTALVVQAIQSPTPAWRPLP